MMNIIYFLAIWLTFQLSVISCNLSGINDGSESNDRPVPNSDAEPTSNPKPKPDFDPDPDPKPDPDRSTQPDPRGQSHFLKECSAKSVNILPLFQDSSDEDCRSVHSRLSSTKTLVYRGEKSFDLELLKEFDLEELDLAMSGSVHSLSALKNKEFFPGLKRVNLEGTYHAIEEIESALSYRSELQIKLINSEGWLFKRKGFSSFEEQKGLIASLDGLVSDFSQLISQRELHVAQDITLKIIPHISESEDSESISLGEGSYGNVYKLRIEKGRNVKDYVDLALKIYLDDAGDLLRGTQSRMKWVRSVFERSSQVTSHHHLLTQYGLITDQCERVAVVMDLGEKSFGTLLNESINNGTFDKARLAFVDYMKGLQVMHESGLLHGDPKPDNGLVMNDDKVVVMDFDTIDQTISSGETAPVIIGSPAFFSPERSISVIRAGDPDNWNISRWLAFYNPALRTDLVYDYPGQDFRIYDVYSVGIMLLEYRIQAYHQGDYSYEKLFEDYLRGLTLGFRHPMRMNIRSFLQPSHGRLHNRNMGVAAEYLRLGIMAWFLSGRKIADGSVSDGLFQESLLLKNELTNYRIDGSLNTLEEFILKMIHGDPSQRLQSLDEVIRYLESPSGQSDWLSGLSPS